MPEIKNYAECYLVTDGRFYWMAYWTPEKEWILADCTNCKNKIDWTDVVAWMPLPELYKEECDDMDSYEYAEECEDYETD